MMPTKHARWLWLELAWTNGDARSKLGISALMQGVEGMSQPDDYARAGDFLIAWGKAIKGEEDNG